MKFTLAQVKGVKADIANKQISLSFTVDLNQLKAAEELGQYVGEDTGDVDILITPRQLPLHEMPKA